MRSWLLSAGVFQHQQGDVVGLGGALGKVADGHLDGVVDSLRRGGAMRGGQGVQTLDAEKRSARVLRFGHAVGIN